MRKKLRNERKLYSESAMSNTLKAFLKYLKSSSIEDLFGHNRVNVVCGNSSADFDSVTCAISYAYCSYQEDPRNPIIPIISIPKSDLSLRRDIIRALNSLSITEDLLFFLEDLKSFKNKKGTLNAVLVDHNRPELEIKPYLHNVKAIIDHHKDESLYPDADPRIVKITGSCSSLVLNYWLKKLENPNLLKEVALLSLGAALIDTSNFTHKVEASDLAALKIYSELLPHTDRNEYYKKIRHDKDDLEGLSMQEILRKDYKQYVFESSEKEWKIGVASVVKPLEWFYSSFGGEPSLKEACLDSIRCRKLDIFVLLTSWVDGADFKRELVITSSSKYGEKNDMNTIIQYLKEKLQLQEKNKVESNAFFAAFEQLDISASRKQIAPFIGDAVRAVN